MEAGKSNVISRHEFDDGVQIKFAIRKNMSEYQLNRAVNNRL